MKDSSFKNNNRPHICFVVHFAYGAMAGGDSGHIGGVERQTSFMAKWFAGCGYKVSIITWDEGQQDGVEIDGVKVFKMCRWKAGLPGFRFLWPRWSSLIAAMRHADADIYYQNCGEYVTGQVGLWCRRNKRKFIYSSANDTDCDVSLPEMKKLRERVLYRYGLKTADTIIVQTRKQKEMMQSGFGYDSVVLPMPCPGPSADEFTIDEIQNEVSNRVLWIGRVCRQKRPDKLLDLAEKYPDIKIDLVGPPSDSDYSRDIFLRAETISNVTVHGSVSRDRVSDFYKKASVLCSTSDFEGFPNTFLEAWSYGLPIVSTFDPDNLIAEKDLGRACGNISELATGINELVASSEKRQAISKIAREYYLQNYAVDSAMKRFENVFLEVVNGALHGKGDKC